MSTLTSRNFVLRLGLHGVDDVWEFDSVLDEEDRDCPGVVSYVQKHRRTLHDRLTVIRDDVPVTLRVELDHEASDIAHSVVGSMSRSV